MLSIRGRAAIAALLLCPSRVEELAQTARVMIKKLSPLSWDKKEADGLKLKVSYGPEWAKQIYDSSGNEIKDKSWEKSYNNTSELIFDFEKDKASGKWYIKSDKSWLKYAKIHYENFRKTIWVKKKISGNENTIKLKKNL